MCLNSSGIFRILFSCELARLKFAVLVFFKTWLEVAVPVSVFIIFSCGSLNFLFLADPVPFLFLFCLVYPNSLALEASYEGLGVVFFSFGLRNVY